ncbi:MAG: hypothetical protein QOH30_6, partial [Baekduia sp.]|nr:hypothetical protein [Baekduia sp.]
MRLAGGAADVLAMRARPAHHRQAAGARVAAAGRARVADPGEPDPPGGDRRGEPGRRHQLAAVAVGEDQHRTAVAGDQLRGLGGCAGGELVGRAAVAGADVARERGDARRRHRPGTPRVLRRVRDRVDRHRGRDRQHGQQRRGGDRPGRASTAPDGDRQPRAERPRDRRLDAGQVARPQVGHAAAQRQAAQQPQRQRDQAAARHAIEAARPPERQCRGQRGQRGDRLDADPRVEVGARGQQAQGPGRARPPRQREDVVVVVARDRRGVPGRPVPGPPGRGGGTGGRGRAAPRHEPVDPVVDQRRLPRRAARRAERPRPRVQRHDRDGDQPR